MEIVSEECSDLTAHELQILDLVWCGCAMLQGVYHVGEGGGPSGYSGGLVCAKSLLNASGLGQCHTLECVVNAGLLIFLLTEMGPEAQAWCMYSEGEREVI